MKTQLRKVFCMCLVAALLLSAIPMQVFADPISYENDNIIGVNFTNAVYDERAMMINAGMIYNVDDSITPANFYLLPANTETTHRMSIWSLKNMDPSKLTLTGATLEGSFSSVNAKISSLHSESYYLYRAVVKLPADGGSVGILYDGIVIGKLTLVRKEIKETYVSETVLTTKNQDDSFTLEFSGVNIPDNASVSLGEPEYDGNEATGNFIPVWTGTGATADSYGVYSINISSVDDDDHRPWMSLAINGSAAHLYSGSTVQIPEMIAIDGSGGSQPDDGLVKPSIIGSYQITDPEISLSITPGDYPEMRYKLGSGNFSEWQNTGNISIDLSKGAFGQYTVSFEFRTSEGAIYETEWQVLYTNNAQADAPEAVFLKDNNASGHKKLTPKNGVYFMTTDESYYPAAVYGNADDESTALEALVYNGGSSEPLSDLVGSSEMLVVDMVRIKGTNNYEAEEPFVAASDNYRIGVRAKKGTYDTQAGQITEIEARGAAEPVIYSSFAPRINGSWYSWADNCYGAERNSDIYLEFSGTVGDVYEGSGVLVWSDVDGVTHRTVQKIDAQGSFNGWYRGNITIPEAASALASLEYRIEINGDSDIYAFQSYDLSSYLLSTRLIFSGIPVEYEGAEIEIKRDDGPGVYSGFEYLTVSGTAVPASDTYMPGNYSYVITGESGELTKGSFTIVNGGPAVMNIQISIVPVSSFTVTIEGMDDLEVPAVFNYRVYYGPGNDYICPGILRMNGNTGTIKQIPIKMIDGTNPTRVEIYADNYSYERPAELTGALVDPYGVLCYDMQDGENKVSTKVIDYAEKNISGKVTNPLGKAVQGVSVTLRMASETGWPDYISGSHGINERCLYAYTDKNGEYRFEGVWADKDVNINFIASGGQWFGSPAYENVDKKIAADDTVCNTMLPYNNYGALRVDLKLQYLGSADLYEGDCRKLQSPEIYKNGELINYNGGDNGVFYLNDARIEQGDTVSVRYKAFSDGFIEGAGFGLYPSDKTTQGYNGHNYYIEATTTLDANSDGHVEFLGKELGRVSVQAPPNEPVTEAQLEAMDNMEDRADALAAATKYEGWLVVFRYGTNEVLSMTNGLGEIESAKLNDGKYKFMSFYLDRTSDTYADDLLSLADPDALMSRSFAATQAGQLIYGDVTVEAGTVAKVNMPGKAAGLELTGGIKLGITTEPLPDFPGWAQVKVNIIPRSDKVRISRIRVKNYSDGISNTVLDTAYVDGVKMTRDWTSYDSYRWYKNYNNTYVEHQDEEPFLMFFTQVESGSESSAAKAKIKVCYDMFDKWSYGAALGTAAVEEEYDVSVDLDPFDLEVAEMAVFDEIYKNKDSFGVITAHVYGNRGDKITLYDGDRKASEFVMNDIREDVSIRLSNPEYFGVHRIRAERTKADGSKDISDTRSISLVNRAKTIYMNEIRWVHKNDTRLEDWHFHEIEDMTETTFRYYPAKASIISFRLNNVKEGELDNVRFITTYHGAETSFRAIYQSSGVDPLTGRSWCEYMVDPEETNPSWGTEWVYFGTYTGEVAMKRVPDDLGYYAKGENPEHKIYPMVGLGYFEDFTAEYELVTVVDDGAGEDKTIQAELESYYKATGGSAPDMNSLSKADIFNEETADSAKEALPSVFRNGYADGSTKTTTNISSDTFSYTMSKGENGMSYTSDASDNASYDPDALQARMLAELEGERESSYTDPKNPSRTGKRTVSWAKYDTLQGAVYIRQTKTDYTVYDANGELASGEKVDIEIAQEIYAPVSVMNAIKNGTTVEEERAKLTAKADLPKINTVATRLMGSLPGLSGGSGSRAVLANDMTVDEGMGHLSTVGNIYGGMDIYQDVRIDKLGEESRFMSKNFGRGMAALGVGLTAYDIAKGVQGKDPEALFNALNSLNMNDKKSQAARQALTNEILSYQDMRSQKYILDSIVNGGLATSGTVEGIPPHVKLGLLAGGMAYNKIGEGTQGWIDNEFDSIMRSILIELNRQDQRDVVTRIELEKELFEKWEKVATILDWGDIWEGEKRISRKQRIINAVEAELNIRFNNERMPRFKMRESFPKLNVYVDPSGYVYEGIPEDRVGGITATLYQSTGGSNYKQWVDNNSVVADRQANPQTTAARNESKPDEGGRYGWMTPYGTFKVGFTDTSGKYLDAETKPMTVPPEHTQVNIGLLSTEAPSVEQIETSGAAVMVTFSKYMQMESLVQMSVAESAKIIGNTDRYDSAVTVVSLFDADGNPISGKISFPASYDTLAENEDAPLGIGKYRVKNTFYKSGTYQVDEVSSDWFVNKIIFTPDDPAAFDPDKSSIMVSKTAQSYAGVGMADDYVKNVAAAERETAPKIYTITLDANGGSGVPATLVTAKDGKLLSLPDPTRDGYTFNGWYASDGSKVTISTVFSGDTTITAGWTGQNSGSSDSDSTPATKPVEQKPVDTIGEITIPEPTTGLSADSFGDVGSGRWSAEAVTYVASRGIFSGNGDGSFSPEAPMTRAMTAQVLYNLAGKPATTNNLTYTDKDSLLWFTDAVAWASNVGLVTGNIDGSFKGNNSITREEFVTIIFRFAQKIGLDTAPRAELTGFSDGNAVRDYAKDAMKWAVAVGLIKGNYGRLDAGFGASREQIAVIMMRLCLMIEANNAAKQ